MPVPPSLQSGPSVSLEKAGAKQLLVKEVNDYFTLSSLVVTVASNAKETFTILWKLVHLLNIHYIVGS